MTGQEWSEIDLRVAVVTARSVIENVEAGIEGRFEEIVPSPTGECGSATEYQA